MIRCVDHNTFAYFKVLKIHEVLKLFAIYDNAPQDILYIHFLIKDSIQGKKNKCFARGGHQGLGGILHIK